MKPCWNIAAKRGRSFGQWIAPAGSSASCRNRMPASLSSACSRRISANASSFCCAAGKRSTPSSPSPLVQRRADIRHLGPAKGNDVLEIAFPPGPGLGVGALVELLLKVNDQAHLAFTRGCARCQATVALIASAMGVAPNGCALPDKAPVVRSHAASKFSHSFQRCLDGRQRQEEDQWGIEKAQRAIARVPACHGLVLGVNEQGDAADLLAGA